MESNSPQPSRARLGPVGLFTGAYLLAAAVAAGVSGNLEFVFYLVVMLLLVAGVLVLHQRVGLTSGALWALSIWGAMHMAGGLVPVPESWPIDGEIRVLYSWWILPRSTGGGWLKYDHVTHAYGFGVATWVCWQALRGVVGPLRPTFGLMILAALAGLGLGALNEVVEFIATLIAHTNVGGYVNTGLDLIANTVGAAIAATIIYLHGRCGVQASPSGASANVHRESSSFTGKAAP
ncbi:MAG TPA: hypothetical protein VF184_06600 [Phycisphaeraceae bacterium]